MDGFSARYAPTGHLVFARLNALWAAPFDVARLELTGNAVRVVENVAADYVARGFAIAHNARSSTCQARRGSNCDSSSGWIDKDGKNLSGSHRERKSRRGCLPTGGTWWSIPYGTTGDLFLYNLETRVEEQFTVHAAIDQWPIWSPDGSHVYFTSTRDGEPGQLYVKPVDGSREEQRVSVGQIGGVGSGWSADGATIIVTQTIPERGIDIFTLGLDGRSAPEELLTTKANEAVPVMSPNGRWIAYRSDEIAEPRIYVRPFPEVGRGPRAVSDGQGGDPLWGRDGRELFFFSPKGVMAVPVETGDTFKRGTPRLLFSLEPYLQAANINWDVSLDGQRFLMVKRVRPTHLRRSSWSRTGSKS